MKTVNHECYVSLEVAKLLKEAGFDWETKHRWDYCKPTDEWSLTNYPEEPVNWNSKHYNYDCSAPTLDVAQRWLREVKRMDVIISVFGGSPDKIYVYEVNTWATWKNGVVTDKEYIGDSYTTYEEAKEAGIKKALEIILEKGE